MNKYLDVIVAVISVVALIANITLFWHIEEAEKEIRKIKNLPIALPQEFHASIEKNLQAANKQTETLAIVTFKDLKEKHERKVQKLVDSIASLARQRIAGNEVSAQNAFDQAQIFIKKGDFISARLYCLNAINHSPNKKKYFEALYRITNAKKITDISELEQLRGVLELGLYQVESKDIPAMSKMLAEVLVMQEKISTQSVKVQVAEEQKKVAAVLASVKKGKYAWESLITEPVETIVPLLRERLNELTNLLANDRVSGEEASFCRKEVAKTSALLEYYVAMFSIDNALKKAENLLASGNATPAVNSMVQSANNILSQSWNIDFSCLPEKSRIQLLAQADRIANLEKQFNKIKSLPAIAKINKLYNNIDLNGNCTQKINSLQEGIKKILVEAENIYDSDERRNVNVKIEDLTKQIKKYTEERYKGYQLWAVGKCRAAIRLYRSWMRVDEDDAERVIKQYFLEIDPALLTPSVSRLYQDILSKQFAEMKWEKIAEMEQYLATSRKKTVEDCPNE